MINCKKSMDVLKEKKTKEKGSKKLSISPVSSEKKMPHILFLLHLPFLTFSSFLFLCFTTLLMPLIQRNASKVSRENDREDKKNKSSEKRKEKCNENGLLCPRRGWQVTRIRERQEKMRSNKMPGNLSHRLLESLTNTHFVLSLHSLQSKREKSLYLWWCSVVSKNHHLRVVSSFLFLLRWSNRTHYNHELRAVGEERSWARKSRSYSLEAKKEKMRRENNKFTLPLSVW